MDQNTKELNKYLERQSDIENSFETLIDNHLLSFEKIREEIDYLMDISRDYDGFDFTEEMQEYIKEAVL